MICETAWLNGELVDSHQRLVHIDDHGLVVGDGVFETIEVTPKGPFAVRRHIDRLARSAEAVDLDVPDDDVLRAAITDTVEANKGDAGVLRLTVTSGPGPLGSARGAGPSTVFITASPGRAVPATAEVKTVPWPRNERGALSGVKSTSYAENVIALKSAADAGADEAIFPNTLGNLCEGTGSNIFVVIDGEIMTPPLTSGCLAGITRGLVVGMLEVTELDMEMSVLDDVSEAFLTSSIRRVQPISKIDGRPLEASPGERTEAAVSKFNLLVDHDLDP